MASCANISSHGSILEKLAEKLVGCLFFPLKPPVSLLKAVNLGVIHTEVFGIDSFFKSKRAVEIYSRLQSDASKKLAYVFLSVTAKIPVGDYLLMNVKRIGLGFDMPHLAKIEMTSPSGIYNIFNLQEQQLSVFNEIIRHGKIYKKIKAELGRYRLASDYACCSLYSLTHQRFLDCVRPIISSYEETLLRCEADFFDIHTKMYKHFNRMSQISRINDMIKHRTYLQNNLMNVNNSVIMECAKREYFSNYGNVIEFEEGLPSKENASYTGKQDGASLCAKTHGEELGNSDGGYVPRNTSLSTSCFDDRLHISKELAFNTLGNKDFLELSKIGDVVYHVCNECTRAYINTGAFHDPYSEYFVKNHTVDYGLIPPFISRNMAETIAYIGKYTSFMKCIDVYTNTGSVAALDLSSPGATVVIADALKNINKILFEDFIKAYKIDGILAFIHSIFLFGRVDFIEYLYGAFKESCRGDSKLNRKSALSQIEEALEDSFPNCPFHRIIDVVVKNSLGTDKDDSFSLYCKLDYPITMVLEEEFVLRLVCIFKFLWKLKCVEHLGKRIGSVKYMLLISKLMHYVHYEAIQDFKFEWVPNHLAVDRLKDGINKNLDGIMSSLFLNTKEKRIERLLGSLEDAFLVAGHGGVFDDTEIKQTLGEFYKQYQRVLNNTMLFDLGLYL